MPKSTWYFFIHFRDIETNDVITKGCGLTKERAETIAEALQQQANTIWLPPPPQWGPVRDWRGVPDLIMKSADELTPAQLVRYDADLRQVSRRLSKIEFGLVLANYYEELAQFAQDAIDAKQTQWLLEAEPPLTDNERAVYKLIDGQPPGEGIIGKQIVAKLEHLQPPIFIEQSTLTRHIIPSLRKHHDIPNRRGVGYYTQST